MQFVLLAVDEHDTRARRIRVTREGSRLAPRAVAGVEAVDEDFFASLPDELVLRVLGALARWPEETQPA